MQGFYPLPFDLSSQPDWFRNTAQVAWLGAELIVVIGVFWLLSVAVAWLIRALGGRLSHRKDLTGSGIDIAAALSRLVILGAGLLVGLEFIGIKTLAFVARNGSSLFEAFLIFVAAWVLSGFIAGSIRDFGNRVRARGTGDGTLFNYLASVVRYVLIAVAGIAALAQMGFTSLIAILGAAGLAIALALQDTLRAVAAGVMLAIFRPFRIGDWVTIADQEGEIHDISPFTTSLLPPDNKLVVIPNDKVWGNVIINSNRLGRRRLDLIFNISLTDDIDHAMGIIETVLEADERTIEGEPVWVGVHEISNYSVRLRGRAWCAGKDFFQLRTDMLRAIKLGLDAGGVTTPLPAQVQYNYDMPGKAGIGRRYEITDDDNTG